MFVIVFFNGLLKDAFFSRVGGKCRPREYYTFFCAARKNCNRSCYVVHWLISTSRKRIQLRFQVVLGSAGGVVIGNNHLRTLEGLAQVVS